MSKKIFVLLAAVAAAPLFCPIETSAASADHLVISQVQITGGSGKTTNDFVEIYNPTAADIDLKGMRLVKRTKTGTTDTSLKSWTDSAIVKAHGYYLWANSSYADIVSAPDVTTTGSLADDNGVAIRSGANDTGTIVDAVAWGEAANAFVESAVFATNPAAGQSLERKPGSGAGNGDDTNSNVADLFLQTASHPRNSGSAIEPAIASPLPSPPPQGEGSGSGGKTGEIAGNPPAFNLQITEIMPNPKGSDSGAEWVEFFNPGTTVFDLNAWILDDDSMETLPGSGFYKIAGPAEVPAGGYLAIVIPKGNIALNNSGEEAIRLFDSGKLMRLRQTFSGPAKEGQSYALVSGQWIWSAGPTPGAANLTAATAPVFAQALKISEILPDPPGDDLEGEFIEVYNYGDDSVELAGWAVADARKRYEVTGEDFSETEIPPRSYFLLYRETTGISLNNSGEEEVRLFDPNGDLVDKITFDAADYGEYAYAWSAGKAWQWTQKPTPGGENIISRLSEPPKEEPGEKAAPKASSKKSPEKNEEAPKAKPVTLSEVRGLPAGTMVETSGVVVVEPGLLGKQVTYLQGSGIRVLLPADLDLLLSPGMKIAFSGEVSQFHNEHELKIAAETKIQVLAEGQETAPHDIATGEVGEETEGFLVRIEGNITESSGGTFYIDDGSGEARVLLADSTGIEKPKSKKGDFASVVGLVTQFNDVYRVMPRYQSDLVFGQVAGATTLPRTGVNLWLMFAVFAGNAIISLRILISKGHKNE